MSITITNLESVIQQTVDGLTTSSVSAEVLTASIAADLTDTAKINVYASIVDFPTATAANRGYTVFAQDDEAHYVNLNGSQWTKLSSSPATTLSANATDVVSNELLNKLYSNAETLLAVATANFGPPL